MVDVPKCVLRCSTDYEGITILQRGIEDGPGALGAGGLEVQDPRSGAWHPVPAPADTLTINIGDLMARWTNDRWRATKHRVPAPLPGSAASKRARLSLVYFTGPNQQAVVECLPSAKCGADKPKYPPITMVENVASKMGSGYALSSGNNAGTL